MPVSFAPPAMNIAPNTEPAAGNQVDTLASQPKAVVTLTCSRLGVCSPQPLHPLQDRVAMAQGPNAQHLLNHDEATGVLAL
jgi:hypothetical protein